MTPGRRCRNILAAALMMVAASVNSHAAGHESWLAAPAAVSAPAGASAADRITAAFTAMAAAWDAKDADGVLAHYAADYLSDGMTRDMVSGFLTEDMASSDWAPLPGYTIQVTVSGSDAVTVVTWSDGRPSWSETGVDTEYWRLEADDTWRMIGNQQLFNARALSFHTPGNYDVMLVVRDLQHAATAVTVSGPGITGELALAYEAQYGQWASWGVSGFPRFGDAPPALPLSYQFTLTHSDATTSTVTATVTAFVEGFATNLSPADGVAVSGDLVFSWNGPGTGYIYRVELADASEVLLWDMDGLTATTADYGGGPLSAGVYRLRIQTVDSAGNRSMSVTTFTYTPTMAPLPAVIDFDAIDATGGAADAAAYLAGFGISVHDVTAGSTVQIVDDANMYGGDAMNPASPPNFLTQGGSNDPVSFTLTFPWPLVFVGFTRCALVAGPSGIVHPQWSAQALDAAGNVIDSVGEGQIASYSDVPAQAFTLDGPGITAVRIDSDNQHWAAFSAVLLDDLVLGAEPLVFDNAVFYGGAGRQRGTGVFAAPDGLYLAGIGDDSHSSAAQAMALGYALPPDGTPVWGKSFGFGTNFLDVTVVGTGVYAAGWNYDLTTDGVGGKEIKAFLARFNADGSPGGAGGDAVWLKPENFFAYTGVEVFNAIAAADEGGTPYLYVAGGGQPASYGAYIVAKYTEQGVRVAAATDSTVGIAFDQYTLPTGAGGSDAQGVAVSGGGVYVAGGSHWIIEEGETGPKAAVWKYDANLSLVWRRKDTSAGGFQDAAPLGDGVVAAGQRNDGAAGGQDALVMAYDAGGNRLWTRTWGGTGDDMARGVAVAGGRVYVTGETASFGAGGKDVFLLELDAADGSILALRTWGGTSDELARSVAVTGANIYVTGETTGFGAEAEDLILLHYTRQSTNNAPAAPSSPAPSDGLTNVLPDADLSWTASDPDTGDALVYDVYFGTSDPPDTAATDLAGPVFDPGEMAYNTTYYWRIVARDSHGAETSGPLWSFSTPAVGTITGQLTTTVTGQTAPVAGATVTIVETGAVVTSAADGSFTFDAVPTGSVTLTVAAPFFAGITVTDVPVSGGQTTTAPETVLQPQPCETGVTGDINDDGKVGLEEAINALQILTGIRSGD